MVVFLKFLLLKNSVLGWVVKFSLRPDTGAGRLACLGYETHQTCTFNKNF
jgi:hypothetical protein